MGINVTARKTGGRVVATLVKGDNRTTRLEIVVPRMSGGVDMADIAWAVNIGAADGRTDVYVPQEVTHEANAIRFEWLPGGIATAAEGLTEFSVIGTADAEDPPVWQSAVHYLQIDEGVDAKPSEGEAEQLTELGKLIVFVQSALGDVVGAGEAAVRAADRANAAAERAEGVVDASEAAVLYTAQELDAGQQAQARQNIGAADAEEVGRLSEEIANKEIPDVSAFVTRAVNDLANYYRKDETYTREEIDGRISAIPKFTISVVSTLPTANISETTIYLLRDGVDGNMYTEHIYVGGAWEVLGSQRVDLTGYATQVWTLEQLVGYQPKGDYALKSEIPTVPTKVSEFTNDAGYLTQHQDISGKLDADKLPEAVNTALAQAKASGEFDGADGEKGADGKTPVKGVDYYTDADKAEFSTYIASELAKRGQLKPEFANGIDECTDSSKLYVLPDGYIYAYIKTEGDAYTNKVPQSINADKTPYIGTNGEKGYKKDYRLNSSGAEAAQSGVYVTGFIPVVYGDTVYVDKLSWLLGGSSLYSFCYVSLYDGNFSHINSGQATDSFIKNNVASYMADETTGQLLSFTIDKAGSENVAYVRLSFLWKGEAPIVTVNEPIINGEPVIKYDWANTGHAFVPADYEARIIELEGAKTDLDKRVSALESADIEGMPEYVVTEAEDVLDRIVAAQGDRTFTFAAISDLHYGNGGNTDGVKHLCKALKYIDKRIKLDAVVVLGDYTDGYPASGYDNAVQDFRTVNAELDDLRFAPNLRTQGNHDYYADHTAMTHRHIQMYSDNVVWGSIPGGYYYRDFDGFCVRTVVLNTSETGNDYVRCSTAQYQWFADALDLSDKSNAADWQILVLSHCPLDWWTADDRYPFGYILNAYQTGTSWSGDGISCDYSGGKNAAKLIGCIHGHIHNLLSGYVYVGKINEGGTPSTVRRIATPEACTGRANQYATPWADAETYAKIPGTAEETSGCIYCIDLEAHVIRAICYGAGYDREIYY